MAERECTDAGELPWHLGVFDVHCHPTDTVASLQAIPGMRAKVLTVMATRAEDQDLVAQTADEFGVTEAEATDPDMNWSESHKVIPAFGWHPWFSHQICDDTGAPPTPLSPSQKLSHYQSVLAPSPATGAPFLSSLPEPVPLSRLLAETRARLARYPLALVGEVGLDRSFRLPETWTPDALAARDESRTPGGSERRRLSPYRVTLDHQRAVLTAQLRLAGEMGRAVSVHGVQAHGVVYETLAATWKGHERKALSKREQKRRQQDRKQGEVEGPKKDAADGGDRDEGIEGRSEPQTVGLPFPPRVCLHSFSGPAETVHQYVRPTVPCDVYFSFSVTINAWAEGGEGKVEAAVKAVPDDRVLIESDLHTAGEEMDGFLADVVRKICEVKGWGLETGTQQLAENWRTFVFGH